MNGLRFLSVATAALAIAPLLGGCAPMSPGTGSPANPPTTAPGPSPSPTETPDPAPGEPAEPVSLPASCDEALPLPRLQELYGGDARIESLPEAAAGLREQTLEYGFGPVAGEALVNAEQSIQCVWGYPSTDFVLQVYAAILAPEVRSGLVAALEDSDFERADEDGVVIFSDYTETGIAPFRKTYFFRGDLWVAEMSTGPQQSLAGRELFERLSP
ncbi:hypothetical protein [Leucobacter sp.]